tara:strand:- start:46 stop:1425 length:1380 start_codon:yes stop_codon:yes gene_type:complete
MADARTTERELSSVYCIFEALELNQLPVTGGNVSSIIRNIWGKTPIPDTDLFAFQHQGQSFKSFLQSNNFPLKGWKYGLFEKDMNPLKSQPGINIQTTTILDDIFKLFDAKHRALFMSKKDTWNPADAYISKVDDSVVLESLKELKEKTQDLPPQVFVALLNDWLRQLFNDKKLIGISLKTSTPPNIPKAKAFNTIRDMDFEPPSFGEAVLMKTGNGYLHQWMAVENKKGALGFKGNSIRFEAEVGIDGGDPIRFSWESKSPEISSPHTTEFKNIVAGKKANTVQLAKARGGGIPKSLKYAPLITEYGRGGGWNHHVPKRSITTAREIKTMSEYWGNYLHNLRKSTMVTLNDVEIKDSKGQVLIDARNNNKAKDIEYMKQLLWIEASSNTDVKRVYGMNKEAKFSQNFRGKLRGLILINTIVYANSQGKLGEFLLRAYYSAAKVRWTVDDLQGPFVKIE